MPVTPSSSSLNECQEKSRRFGSRPPNASKTNNTAAATVKRTHTSVGASTNFNTCRTAIGSVPHVIAAKSANAKPRSGLWFSILISLFLNNRIAGRCRFAASGNDGSSVWRLIPTL